MTTNDADNKSIWIITSIDRNFVMIKYIMKNMQYTLLRWYDTINDMKYENTSWYIYIYIYIYIWSMLKKTVNMIDEE